MLGKSTDILVYDVLILCPDPTVGKISKQQIEVCPNFLMYCVVLKYWTINWGLKILYIYGIDISGFEINTVKTVGSV